MEDFSDRKQNRRSSFGSNIKKDRKIKDELLEHKSKKQQIKNFKNKKNDMAQDELWEEWENNYE
jgi:hypothetical protein